MEKPLSQHIVPGRAPLSLKEYEKVGGYEAVRKVMANEEKERAKKVVTIVSPSTRTVAYPCPPMSTKDRCGARSAYDARRA